MANTPHFGMSVRDTMLNDINASLGAAAVFLIYAGNQPADASTVVTAANVVIASLLCNATTAFITCTSTSGSAVMTARAITSDASAVGGTAGWFAICQSNATTRICQGEVGTSGADLNLNSVTITTGAAVAITAFTVTLAA